MKSNTKSWWYSLLSAGAVLLAVITLNAYASEPREISWDDLIPPGVEMPQIIGEGEMDVENDTWNPIFDENATKLNELLNGANVKLPGYIIPLDMASEGVTNFILVPYVGACIHVPPPPPNQLVMVNTDKPWPNDKLWDAVWVSGKMSTKLQDTDLAQIGYEIEASKIEVYVW